MYRKHLYMCGWSFLYTSWETPPVHVQVFSLHVCCRIFVWVEFPIHFLGNSTHTCTGVFASCVLQNICVVVLVAPNMGCGGLQWHQFITNLCLFLFYRWVRCLQPEDRAEISLTCSGTYVSNTPLFLIGSQS